MYFDRPAKPSHSPAASHRPKAARGDGASKNSRASVAAAPSSAKSSTPSGTTQVPAEAKKNGVRLSATSAISPARASEQAARQREHQPAGRGEQRNERQPRRRAFAERQRGEMGDPLMQRRMIEIGEVEPPRHDDGVGFVETGAERCGEGQPRQREDGDERQRAAAAIVLDARRRIGEVHEAARALTPSMPGMNASNAAKN